MGSDLNQSPFWESIKGSGWPLNYKNQRIKNTVHSCNLNFEPLKTKWSRVSEGNNHFQFLLIKNLDCSHKYFNRWHKVTTPSTFGVSVRGSTAMKHGLTSVDNCGYWWQFKDMILPLHFSFSCCILQMWSSECKEELQVSTLYLVLTGALFINM